MWHLFDRYKGVVWPKARQLNQIAKILNNLCAGTGIKLDTPTVPSLAAPVTIAVDTEWLDEYIGEGGGSGGGGMFAWNNGTIGAGGVLVGRKFYTIASSSNNSGTALYSVKVEFGSGGTVSASVVSTATIGQAPNDTVCYIPIYEVADGAIVHDYRGAFVVPCWE